jgi:hypothetical protein
MPVLILCIAEFDLKASVLLTTNVDNENMFKGFPTIGHEGPEGEQTYRSTLP